MAAGVYFADEDIVILALNGLPAEYNTFRCVVRGRESVISLKEFRSQLLAEERIVENILPDTSNFLSAMHTISTSGYKHPEHDLYKPLGSVFRPPCNSPGSHTYDNGGYKPFHRNRGRGRTYSGQRSFFPRALVQASSQAVSPSVPNAFGTFSASP